MFVNNCKIMLKNIANHVLEQPFIKYNKFIIWRFHEYQNRNATNSAELYIKRARTKEIEVFKRYFIGKQFKKQTYDRWR